MFGQVTHARCRWKARALSVFFTEWKTDAFTNQASMAGGALCLPHTHSVLTTEIEREYTFVSILSCFIDTRVICYDQLALKVRTWQSQIRACLPSKLSSPLPLPWQNGEHQVQIWQDFIQSWCLKNCHVWLNFTRSPVLVLWFSSIYRQSPIFSLVTKKTHFS